MPIGRLWYMALSDGSAVPIGRKYHGTRSRRLAAELRYALRSVRKEDIAACIKPIPQDAVRAASRRGQLLLSLAGSVIQVVGGEASQLVRAARHGSGGAYVTKRLSALGLQAKRRIDALRMSLQNLPHLARAAQQHPSEVLPELVGAILGFAAGSGGLDADGGIPDLDLLFGIGAHRSPLTHTMVIGVGAECVALSLSRLIRLVHAKLPSDRDPIWDQLHSAAQRTVSGTRVGTSLGLGFHLLADGTLQVAPLHGLGVALPMEAHQAIITLSGAAEAAAGFEQLRLAARRIKADIRRYHVERDVGGNQC
jgi:hypothetical protein